MRPWLELTRELLGPELDRSPLSALLAPAVEPAAFAIVAGYLGLNMLTRFMPDQSETDALFALAEQFARLLPAAPHPAGENLG
jgi:hypothetical protein